jgi:hydroxymethylbilane synthase
MQKVLRIGTRDSQLAVWQAALLQNLLKESGIASELVYIKSEGDIDTVTPLYELGVQGVFTKTLDAALLNNRIDLAVHSMKDVPTLLAKGIQQAAVLKRASYKDIFVYKGNRLETEDALGIVNGEWSIVNEEVFNSSSGIQHSAFTIATSSIRRIAQWKHRYPHHQIENLRGNVNTRLRKVQENNWNGAIFAAAGLDRINLRPQNYIDLDWMLPAPAQGAIMIVCRQNDEYTFEICQRFNDSDTALCTKIERDFLRTLMGGCSTPVGALAEVHNSSVHFRGNIVRPDGKEKGELEKILPVQEADNLGVMAAREILANGGQAIVNSIQKKQGLLNGKV